MDNLHAIVLYICIIVKLHLLVRSLSTNNVYVDSSISELVTDHISAHSEYPENTVVWEDIELKPKGIISSPKVEKISKDVALSLRFDKRSYDRDRGFTQEIKMQILDLHNLYRSNVTPPAGNMAFMVSCLIRWDK
ncbi:hypothetical protein NPIL_308611 [Nephila pilipes]|uniref:Uncharacterized protein n=1 Tax=Nephila pilipes TaxID=299642 RepID=A0A8X6TZB8_NEPPI|nr:hypothetical protein NPIL_308611 [Nephila pilipes]